MLSKMGTLKFGISIIGRNLNDLKVVAQTRDKSGN